MLSAEIKPYFTTEELNQLAREAGFVQRSSKLDGATFLDLIVFHKEELKNQSLNGLCLTAYKEYGIALTKQSLHERFNAHAVGFLRKVVEQLLQKNLKKDQFLHSIQGFSSIRIKDSTCFQISENGAQKYPGCGGSGSKASVRIQFEFDLLSGSIVELSVGAFNEQDATNSITTIESVKEEELVIRDLAYMSAKVLRKIIERLAYFVCRLHPTITVYEKNPVSGALGVLDFEKLYTFMSQNQLSLIEKEIVLDRDDPLRLRLIISLLPPEEVSKRIARIRDQQKKKKRGEPTKQFLIRCHFNLFLTNAGAQQIPQEMVWELYKLRWMIELIFKTWKSVWRIQAIKKVHINRLDCYLYAKVILILTNWSLIWQMIQKSAQVGRVVLSIDKCSKFFSTLLRELSGLFTGSIKGARRCLYLACKKINHLLIERHGKKKTLMENIMTQGYIAMLA